MTKAKRKNDEFGYDDGSWRVVEEPRGCDTYFSAAIQYPFNGSGALIKLLIAALVNLVPVVGSLVFSGYMVRTVRAVQDGENRLPAWDDFGGDIVNGLLFVIGMFIFGMLLMLSMMLIVTIPFVIFFGFPMYAYIIGRFADTGDFAAFFDIIGAYRSVLMRFGDAIVMGLSSLAVMFVLSIAAGFGSLFFVLPGLILTAALSLAIAYNIGMFSRPTLYDASY